MHGFDNTNYLKRMSLRFAAAFSFCCLLAMQTGCMVTPNTSERVTDRDDPLFVMMATLSPEDVTIQARNRNNGQWQDIGIVETYYDSVEFAGFNWVVGSNDIRIPNECWEVKLAGYSVDRIYYEAEIRAVTEAGLEAQTYRRGFYEWMLGGLEANGGGLRINRDSAEADMQANGTTLKIRTNVISL